MEGGVLEGSFRCVVAKCVKDAVAGAFGGDKESRFAMDEEFEPHFVVDLIVRRMQVTIDPNCWCGAR